MIRVFCKNQTFRLNAVDGTSMTTKPNDFNEIPEKFANDPTFKMALSAGAIEKFQSAKQGDKLASEANKGKGAKQGDKGAKDKEQPDGDNAGGQEKVNDEK